MSLRIDKISKPKNIKLISSKAFLPPLSLAKDIEFIPILKPEDGFNVNNFKEIRKSKTELVISKPRNKFIIYRSLVRPYIKKEPTVFNFNQISHISSKMYKTRSKHVDRYLAYISEKEEEFNHRTINLINERSKLTKEKIAAIKQKIGISTTKSSIKIKQYKRCSNRKPLIVKRHDKIEDVFLYNGKIKTHL